MAAKSPPRSRHPQERREEKVIYIIRPCALRRKQIVGFWSFRGFSPLGPFNIFDSVANSFIMACVLEKNNLAHLQFFFTSALVYL